jgi:tetratricopeptide (TPR) repeat protein
MHERELSIQPDGALTRNRLAAVYEDEGEAHWLSGDRVSAEKAYRTALGMREKLVTTAPANGEFAGSLVSLIARFGGHLEDSGRVEDARAETRRVLQILRSQADSRNAAASRLTEYAWLLLIARPPDLRDATTALAYARRALDMPHGIHPDSLAVLAVAEQMTGDAEAAVATALRVYDLVPAMRAGRNAERLRLDVRENLSRHRLETLARPLWF